MAEGPKLARELMHHESSVKHIYATASWLSNNATVSVPVTEISETELERISKLQTPNEVVVIAHQMSLKDEPALTGRLTVVLDGIQDPGNLGTIVRTSDWFGIQQIICSEDCADIYNPKTVQSTMGSLLRVSCFYENFFEWKPNLSIPVIGALLSGKNVFSIEKVSEGLVVIGNESKGIREPFLSKITHAVTIPKTGNAESLNAAVAAGIILGCLVNK